MKLEWRRPTAPSSWLLLKPGAEQAAWRWALVEAGSPVRQGQGMPPSGLSARPALIVPGEACSHFQVPAPPGLKREEWPLLLEDRLLQGAEEVLCTSLGGAAGELRLVTVERQRLDDWRAVCAAWGVVPERCWAEFQLLPEPAPGCCWHWRQDETRDLFKGVCVEGRHHWLAWPAALADQRPAQWEGLQVDPLEGDWPAHLGALDTLPGLFEQRRGGRRTELPRLPWRLAVACLALTGIWGGLWFAQQWRQADLYRAQVQAVTGQQATARQAAQVLKRLREADRERQLRLRQLEGLQTELHGWLREHPGWRLRGVRFDGQRWHVRVDGEGDAPPWQALASAAGAGVQVQPGARPAQWQVVFDLGAAS
ncbi:type II secretion system protein GspL [Pseudomonas capeferrum]|uniref:type II secretion system protein GspL n=1 Tax=Pseudomonas capeferrum TaxID=1495066 RepID=UPI0015E2DEDA|nr:type II secretion system protein GspL [Pseudomonas capeferrum]MBA1203696.1 type II secretion system protein GspL [Pseudomonas capeferrum]